MPRTLLHGTLIALLILPTFASAASGDIQTGSGSVVQDEQPPESEVIREDRAKRAENLRTVLLKAKKVDAQYQERLAAYRKKRAEHRRDCRDDVRRSNRDTKFPTLLRCYEGELSLEKDFLQFERTSIEELPAVTTLSRRAAADRASILLDAIDTVLFAIDSGVYTNADDLTEARANLTNRYRAPYRSALALTRADRTLAMISSLIIRLDATGADGTEPDAARKCLTTQETNLRLLLQLRGENAFGDVGQILPRTHACVELLKKVAKDTTGSGTIVP
jgi:hypothetical protein